MTKTKTAAIQMVSGPDVRANLETAERLVRQASQQGAQLVVLPETFACFADDAVLLAAAEESGSGPVQAFVSALARELKIWIVAGTIPLMQDCGNRFHPSCLVFDHNGEQVARYDKIHLFDVHIESSNEDYRESDLACAGRSPVAVDTPFGRMGLAVCYDLRFPELFRSLVDMGMQFLAMPAAFTAATGKVHWEVLVKARAIENLSYVIAANQGGKHPSGRETWGHSLILDPWGGVLAGSEKGEDVILAEMDMSNLVHIRKTFPALEHKNRDLLKGFA